MGQIQPGVHSRRLEWEEIEEQKQNDQSERSYSGCIVLCGFSLLQISNFAQKYGYSVLDGKQSFNKSAVIKNRLTQSNKT